MTYSTFAALEKSATAKLPMTATQANAKQGRQQEVQHQDLDQDLERGHQQNQTSQTQTQPKPRKSLSLQIPHIIHLLTISLDILLTLLSVLLSLLYTARIQPSWPICSHPQLPILLDVNEVFSYYRLVALYLEMVAAWDKSAANRKWARVGGRVQTYFCWAAVGNVVSGVEERWCRVKS